MWWLDENDAGRRFLCRGAMTFHSSLYCGFSVIPTAAAVTVSCVCVWGGANGIKSRKHCGRSPPVANRQREEMLRAAGWKAVLGQAPTGCDFVSVVALWFKSSRLCDSFGPVPVTCSQLHLLYIMVIITANTVLFRSKGMPTPNPLRKSNVRDFYQI